MKTTSKLLEEAINKTLLEESNAPNTAQKIANDLYSAVVKARRELKQLAGHYEVKNMSKEEKVKAFKSAKEDLEMIAKGEIDKLVAIVAKM